MLVPFSDRKKSSGGGKKEGEKRKGELMLDLRYFSSNMFMFYTEYKRFYRYSLHDSDIQTEWDINLSVPSGGQTLYLSAKPH